MKDPMRQSEGRVKGGGKGTFLQILRRFIDIRDAYQYVVDNVKSGSLIPTVVKTILSSP